MATQRQITIAMNLLLGMQLACPEDGTRLRYGDCECPHCGADVEEHLRAFAERLVDSVAQVQ